MEPRTRRAFLTDVGKGMLVASVGTALASDLGVTAALAASDARPLDFGRLELLVELMQENPADRMLPLVVERMSQGATLRELVAAAALANSRTFGGEDYVGFHAFMALAPAYEMSKELAADRRALPVLKVLYRSTNQIQAKGGRSAEVLHEIDASSSNGSSQPFGAMRDAARHQDTRGAETILSSLVRQSPQRAYDDLQGLVQDDADVHRTVLAYRAWDLLGLTGYEHAFTTLRQSVHYCVNAEKERITHGRPEPAIRALLPKLLDQYGIERIGRRGKSIGSRHADDNWIRSFRDTLLASNPSQAAEAVASALAEGFSPESVGEALSLGATQQVLRDPGRTIAEPGKPVGSVHGASVGVHASDSMNAWRNIAKVTAPQFSLSGLIVAGYHLSAGSGGRDWTRLSAYPFIEHRENVKTGDATQLLRDLDRAIRENDQARACAATARYGEVGGPVRPVLDLFLRYATSEDGALHAEKYYRTVSEEFGRTRSAFRWEHVVALARVTASEYGKRADGYDQARALLKLT